MRERTASDSMADTMSLRVGLLIERERTRIDLIKEHERSDSRREEQESRWMDGDGWMDDGWRG